MKTRISILVASLGFARLVLSQGFVNLDFESAKIISDPSSPYYPYGIATSNAIPGWTAILGASQQSQITYNAPAIGSTWVNLWAAYGSQLSGNYSVLLQGGMTASSASISQTGLVQHLQILCSSRLKDPVHWWFLLAGRILIFFLWEAAQITPYMAQILPLMATRRLNSRFRP